LTFLFFELVALWAELPEAFLDLLSFGSLLSFFFIPWAWSGRRAVPAAGNAAFVFWIFDRRLCRSLLLFVLVSFFARVRFGRVTRDRVRRAPPRWTLLRLLRRVRVLIFVPCCLAHPRKPALRFDAVHVARCRQRLGHLFEQVAVGAEDLGGAFLGCFEFAVDTKQHVRVQREQRLGIGGPDRTLSAKPIAR